MYAVLVKKTAMMAIAVKIGACHSWRVPKDDFLDVTQLQAKMRELWPQRC